ncbi:flocculation protein FLO11 isoform X2 [Folsomia candida]|uniref:Uncharacterized protein n=1 Tax=Folsomia candida TaxID=158441 RepID=A0A226E1A5_FOLCA|nr:flocculation protein FLO11 isoform X2 [Folsomia candida]OXA50711.1 hypothetical protein Fcan01_14318 [Folsomia candida]
MECSDTKDTNKEKVSPTPPPPSLSLLGPTTTTPGGRKGTNHPPSLPPVEFIHVNSGRIELHPGAESQIRWGQHLTGESRHSWCGPQQQMGVIDKQNGTKNVKNCPSKGDVAILQRLADLESVSKTVPSLAPVVSALKEEVAASVGRQERLVADLEGLHVRVNTLETHNKALANIILPTLIRLTKERSPSPNSSLKKATSNASTSPIKVVSPPVSSSSSEEESNIKPTKMRQASKTTPSKINTTPGMMSKERNFNKSSSVPSKKTGCVANVPQKTAGSLNSASKVTPNSSQKPLSTECRIPFFRHASGPSTTATVVSTPASSATTHPPKTTPVSKSKPKMSKLPVRKSYSSSGPSTSVPPPTSLSFLPSSKQNKKATTAPLTTTAPTSLIIDNKRFLTGCGIPSAGPTSLPPKDEGYSTMSNGAIDAQLDPLVPTTSSSASTATFTRPKKLGEIRPPSEPNSGTWTKKVKSVAKSSPSPTSGTRTFATATIASPASITTTKENVRIVHGLPTEIRFSSSQVSGDTGGAVLLEDSDDSDILFLPIEVSSSGSESTLVPYPYSRTSGSDSTYYTAPGGTTTDTSSTFSTPRLTKKKDASRSKDQKKPAPWCGDEVDEQDLVQRWMRLDDMRHEQQEAGADDDELSAWSWDWDGLVRTGNGGPSTNKNIPAMIVTSSSETLDVVLPPKSRLSRDMEIWETPTTKTTPKKSPSIVDSSTWTKSKRTSYLEQANLLPSPSPSLATPVVVGAELDFTAEFYRLTSPGMEDKVMQTSDDNVSDTEKESDLFLQCKNCLEKMSKLISLQQDNPNGGEDKPRNEDDLGVTSTPRSITEQVAQMLRCNNYSQNKEGSASKWMPVPRQAYTNKRTSPSLQSDRDRDRNFALVSSTESEGLISPGME